VEVELYTGASDRQAEARETARRHESRALHVYQDEDGMLVVRGRLAPEVGALLVQALTAAREALYHVSGGRSTRGRRARAGWENVWMWAGRFDVLHPLATRTSS
jgi:hypothetical protein